MRRRKLTVPAATGGARAARSSVSRASTRRPSLSSARPSASRVVGTFVMVSAAW
ncbi:MAG: hypothetical protein HY744_34325 [Deltaproteobacteria bacterium]|nr:hypothetical protein [Deltaproteobacteria bacterium]